jgi:NTE family protein
MNKKCRIRFCKERYKPFKFPCICKKVLTVTCCMVLFCTMASAQVSSNETRPRVALVLEGGGALGLAHIGVIKVLEELGIPVDIVVGTSMGAIVGGFYAQGFDASRLEGIASDVDWLDIFSEGMNSGAEPYLKRIDRSRYFATVDFDGRGFKIPGSLLSGRKLLYLLDRLTISTFTPVNFDTLPRRYRAVATDLATGERVVIDRGSLADAMRASMSIPGVFTPYLIGGRYLVDGGVVDNLPVSTAREIGADLIIAVDLLGGAPFDPEKIDQNPLDTLTRTMEIMIRANVKKQLSDADLVINVDLSGYQMTDFGKTGEIMDLGEKAARDFKDELQAFKTGLAILPKGETDVFPELQTPIQQVIVKGGSRKDQVKTYNLFAPTIGTILDYAFLERSIASLEALGIYEFIRVQRVEEGAIPTVVVRLTKSEPRSQSLRLGMEYNLTYSSSTMSNFSLSPGLIFRGLTTEDSRLEINIGILDLLVFQAFFVQPLGDFLFFEGLFSAHRSTETYGSNSTIGSVYQTRAMDVGISFGVNPATWAEAAIGLRYEWIETDLVPDSRAGNATDSLLMAGALFAIQRLDSPIFPMEGVSTKLQYDQSLWDTGNLDIFRTLMFEGLLIPALNIPFSFTLWGKVGSDFSEYADDSTAAPFYFKPDLAGRHFFPGPMEVGERIGSHIAGIGGEIKFQLNWASDMIGFPSFLLLQGAVGSVLQDISDINRLQEFTHWNAMLGVGTRLNDGFGASFRFGLMGGFGGHLRPVVTLDLGCFGF